MAKYGWSKSTLRKNTRPVNGPAARTWITWASLSTVFASVGYGAFYLTGLYYHRSQLRHLKLPESLFDKKTEDYFVLAHVAWLEFFAKLFTPLMVSWMPWAVIVGLLFLGITLGFLLDKLSNSARVISFQKTVRNNRRITALGLLIFVPFLVPIALVTVAIAIIIVGVLPIMVAEIAANETIARELKYFEAGCDAKESKRTCYELMEDDQAIAKGFIVDTSDKYVAMITDDGATIIPFEDRWLRTYKSPKKK